MYDIETQEASPEFAKCWQAAGLHLQRQVQGGLQTWLRAHLSPPFLEHLSFRLGNQLFFVRIEDTDGKLDVPGSRDGLFSIADGCKGHPCIMYMKKNFFGGGWVPDRPGWGLEDARTQTQVSPIDFVTDEKIEMTEWEVHDFAVQVVRDQLKREGYKVMSSHGNPGVKPSIWFVGDSRGPEWVVVGAARYPAKDAQRPSGWTAIAERCVQLSKIGHFASVAFVSVDQPFAAADEHPVPLWRGHGVHVNYRGLSR